MAKFKIPTEREFETISRQTAKRMKHQLLAVTARYDRRSKHVRPLQKTCARSRSKAVAMGFISQVLMRTSPFQAC